MQLEKLKKTYVLSVIESYESIFAICYVLNCEEGELKKFCRNNNIKL